MKIHRNIVKIDKVNYYPATVHLVAAGGWIKQIKYEKVACYDDVSSFTKSPSNTTTLQQQQLPSSLNMFFFCIHSFASHSILTRSLESLLLNTLMNERVFFLFFAKKIKIHSQTFIRLAQNENKDCIKIIFYFNTTKDDYMMSATPAKTVAQKPSTMTSW